MQNSKASKNPLKKNDKTFSYPAYFKHILQFMNNDNTHKMYKTKYHILWGEKKDIISHHKCNIM